MSNALGTSPTGYTLSTDALTGGYAMNAFSLASGGDVTKIRFWKATTGYATAFGASTLTGHIWHSGNVAGQTFLIPLTDTAGWAEVDITPFTVTAGEIFGVEVQTLTGRYTAKTGSLPLTANGITIKGGAYRESGEFMNGAPAEPVSGAVGTASYGLDIEASTITALAVDAGSDQSIFTTGTASLTATPSGGTGSKTVVWTKVSGPAGTFSSTTTASTVFTPSGAGTYVLRAIATDAASATAQDDLTVTVTAAPTLVSLASIASSTGWTPTGGTVIAVLSDSDDSTLITSSDNPTNVLFDGTFASVAAPNAGQNFTVRIRCRKVGAAAGTLTCRLYEGATLRSTQTVTPPNTMGDIDVSFPSSDIAVISAGAWTSGVRLTVSATATA